MALDGSLFPLCTAPHLLRTFALWQALLGSSLCSWDWVILWGVWKRVTFRLVWVILTCSFSSWLYSYSPFIHLSNRLYHPSSLYFLTFLFMHSLKLILLIEIFNNYLATKGWFSSCFPYNLLLFTIISSFYLSIWISSHLFKCYVSYILVCRCP